MSISRQLSYEGLKIVLSYMDANKRIKIERHIPSIRKTERFVPLKIDKLQVNQHKVTVNETCYTISTYRKYPEDMDIPPYHANCNRNVDYCEDLDEFGAVDKRPTDELTPGDIYVVSPTLHYKSDRYEIMSLMKEIAIIEEALKLHEEGSSFNLPRIQTIEEANYKLGCARNKLQSLEGRMNNVSPAYQVMLKLEINDHANRTLEVQLFEKTMRIHEMCKKLTTSMFGNRGTPIIVNKMAFGTYFYSPLTIMRLPVDIKYKIRELLASNPVVNAIAPIIDERSLPLEVLRLHENYYTPEDLRHPWELNARKLILPHTVWNSLQLHIPLIFSGRNFHVEIGNLEEKFMHMLHRYIRKLIQKSVEIGTCVSLEKIGMEFKENMLALESLCQWLNGKKFDERTIIVPFNQDSKLKVTCKIKLDSEKEEDRIGFIKLVVIPI